MAAFVLQRAATAVRTVGRSSRTTRRCLTVLHHHLGRGVLTFAVVILGGCGGDKPNYSDIMAQQPFLSLGGTVQIAPVKAVDLSDTAVTDADLVHLSSLRGLQKVNLRHTAISDNSVPHLLCIEGLEDIGLSDTKVTDAGIRRLKTAFPGIRVVR
jgi:hypothetical protein